MVTLYILNKSNNLKWNRIKFWFFISEMYFLPIAIRAPVIKWPLADVTEKVYRREKVELDCLAEGVPAPEIEWYKVNILLIFINIYLCSFWL